MRYCRQREDADLSHSDRRILCGIKRTSAKDELPRWPRPFLSTIR